QLPPVNPAKSTVELPDSSMTTVICFIVAILESPHSEQQLDLLALFCLDDLPAPQDVTSLASHGECALFFVSLMHAVQPFLIEADAPVILGENGAELTIGVPYKSDIVRSAIEMIAPNDD